MCCPTQQGFHSLSQDWPLISTLFGGGLHECSRPCPADLKHLLQWVSSRQPNFQPLFPAGLDCQHPNFLLHGMSCSLTCGRPLPFRHQPERGHLPAAIAAGGCPGVPPPAERLHTSSAGAGRQCDHNSRCPYGHTCHPHIQPIRAQCEWDCSIQAGLHYPFQAYTQLPLFGVSSRPWVPLICAASMMHAGCYFAAASRTHLCVCQNAYASLQLFYHFEAWVHSSMPAPSAVVF